MLNVAEEMDKRDWRSDFLIFDRDEPVAFLDSAASAQKPRQVIFAMNDVMQSSYANIHRGLYEFSQSTTSAYEAVRGKVATFINAPDENEIIFTRNSTESFNLVVQSWGRANLQRGDEIILSEMEHHANIVPWQLLQKEIGFEIKTISVNENAVIQTHELDDLLNKKTKFVSLVMMSNATGVKNPVSEIVQTVRSFSSDIKIMLDATQAVVHDHVDVKALDVDFITFTGHKLYGPTGIGVLWGRLDILNNMPPFLGGGDMIDTVSFSGTTFKDAPARFEAGTPAIIETIGLGAAIDYVSEIGLDKIITHEKDIYDYAYPKLMEIEGLTLYGDVKDKGPILSFSIDGIHSSDLGTILDQMNVCVRSGHHCCMPLMESLGITGTTRASIGLYNTKEDIDMLITGLDKAKRLIG